MKLHPRTMIVNAARNRIESALLDAIQREPDLTETELVQILLGYAQTWSTYALRKERHPDDPAKKADEA